MDDSDLELIDAVFSMAIAAGTGDEEALEVFLQGFDPASLAVAGADVIWRMATALGQMVDPPRSPPQMIHVFAQALREPGAEQPLTPKGPEFSSGRQEFCPMGA